MSNKKIFFIVWVFLLFSAVSHAEIIFLKSGKIVEGKILERKSNGNVNVDIEGVTIEYFHDEILGIKRKNYGDFVKKMYLLDLMSPDKIVIDYCNAMVDQDLQKAYEKLTKRRYVLVKDNQLDLYDKDKEKWKGLRSFQVISDNVVKNKAVVSVLFTFDDRRAEEEFTLVKQHGEWRIDNYSYHGDNLPSATPPSALKNVFASVSGIVKLPKTSKEGHLSIVFVPDGVKKNSGRPYFLNVAIKGDIAEENYEVPYIMDHLIPGSYKVFALWDVAAPFINDLDPQKAEFDLTGDFIAETDPIKLDFNDKVTGIDLRLKKYSGQESSSFK